MGRKSESRIVWSPFKHYSRCVGSQKPISDDQTEKKMKRPDEKEVNDTEIPLLCKRFQFCLFFINIKTNLMHLNYVDGNEKE